MARTPADLDDADFEFLAERHVGTLTTLRGDGTPHVVAIAFGYDPTEGRVRVICGDGGQKVVNVDRTPWAVVTQVDGPRWLSLEGPARVVRDGDRVARAVAAFEARYRPASERPDRVAIEIDVERILGRSALTRSS